MLSVSRVFCLRHVVGEIFLRKLVRLDTDFFSSIMFELRFTNRDYIQFGRKSLARNLPRLCIVCGDIWKAEIVIADIEALEESATNAEVTAESLISQLKLY